MLIFQLLEPQYLVPRTMVLAALPITLHSIPSLHLLSHLIILHKLTLLDSTVS